MTRRWPGCDRRQRLPCYNRALGVVLRQIDDVVQIACGLDHHRIRLLMGRRQSLRNPPDAVQVADVVRAIIVAAVDRESDQSRLPAGK